MPAILKGWVDRVFARGFAYGVGGSNRWRYDNGNLKGKRAMLAITVGGPAQDYSERGINGPMDDLLPTASTRLAMQKRALPMKPDCWIYSQRLQFHFVIKTTVITMSSTSSNQRCQGKG
jgi:putative NADPH-quinone reductase